MGCLCYATKTDFHDKFNPKFIPGVFMGYASTQKGYRVYDIAANKFITSRNVVFKEEIFPFRHPKHKFLVIPNPNPSHLFPYIFPSSNIKPELSTNIEPEVIAMALQLLFLSISFSQAVKEDRWIKAMKLEIEALEQNNTWEVVNLPPGQSPYRM
uniref:Uncharacterized protein LOC104239591 n=1 Tax=Nicotiana sylvestris TaxID=4096 RepID=A0A1U7XKI7_NICSY|nr:PREDICTED: uncharacterized protein LOC104239591 [Nicotiana sylvestris]